MRNIVLAGFVIAMATALMPAPLGAQAYLISIYTQPGGDGSYAPDGLPMHTVYVVLSGANIVSGVRYTINTCLSSWVWLGEANEFPSTTGSSQTGVTVEFDDCLSDSSILLQSITFFDDGTSLPNSSIWVEAHPDAAYEAPEVLAYCGSPLPIEPRWVPIPLAGALCVNCEPGTFCGITSDTRFWLCPTCSGIPLPVEVTTWGSVKALYR